MGVPRTPWTGSAPEHERPAYHVRSLARGLSVIRAFDGDHPSQTLSQVAQAAGLTRAAARRFLLTLADLGYVATDGSRFWLTPRVLELGYAYLSSLTLPEVAQPHLERLAAKVQESTSVSVLDGDDVVYVARVATSRIMAVSITVGTRFPAYATSMGRVLLAGIDAAEMAARFARLEPEPLTPRTLTDASALREEVERAREQGHAIVDQELELGLRSIATPIHDHAGRVIAAVNVSTHTSRATLDAMRRELLPPLLRTAQAIGDDLAALGAHSQQGRSSGSTGGARP